MNSISFKRNDYPRIGGDLVLYSRNSPKSRARLVFINGICTTPQSHRDACENLCDLTGCEVMGVYNQFGGGPLWGALDPARALDLLPDKARAAIDKLSLPGASINKGLFDVGQSILDALGVALRASVPGFNSIRLINGCASSLYYLLLHEGPRWPSSPICIVAHSQGNLIASNALFFYSAMVSKYKFVHPKIRVFAVASPAVSWPTKIGFIDVDPIWHGKDPVTAFSMLRNRRGTNDGKGAKTDNSWSHEFESYADDKKFVDTLRAALRPGAAP